jgi:hypothetical protein
VRALAWILGVVLVLATLALARGAYLANTPEGQQRSRERDAIAACREAQNDTLQELATRRLIREGCDRLAADFRRKWNREP